LRGNWANRGTLKQFCFAPSTLVDTPQGKRAIAEINPGEQVYAFDFASGQWVARSVLERHDNRYQGAWITLHTSGGTIECTAYHPFWVAEGYALNERARPRELAEREDEGQQLVGRWVNSHDLMAGDMLISRDGRQIRLLKIEQHYVEEAPICNLTIDDLHNFSVGADRLLVHNTGGCGDRILENAKEGAARELRVFERLKSFFKVSSVQRERLLRTADGKKAIDPLTGEGRRIDFAIIQKGEVRFLVEVTSKTADKASQIAKEVRIRAQGGTFVRDKITGQLIDVSDMITRILRRN